MRGGEKDQVEGQEGEEREKKREIQDGIEDGSVTDGMIMVKLEHEGKMKGFSVELGKEGQAPWDGGGCCTVDTLRKRAIKKSNGGIGKCNHMDETGKRGIWIEMASGMADKSSLEVLCLLFAIHFLGFHASFFLYYYIIIQL